MRHASGNLLLVVMVLVFCWPVSLNAWEIQLKSRVALKSAVVRLHDIVTITGVDEQTRARLQRIVIAPAPTRSITRSITASQLRRVLTQYGVDLSNCRFVGQARVIVQYSAEKQSAKTTSGISSVSYGPRRTPAHSRQNLEQLKQQLADEVLREIGAQGASAESWQVDVTLARRILRTLPDDWKDVQIEGLTPPWDGPHDIVARFASDEQIARVPLRIRLARTEQQVVALRPLARGHIVGPRDVELRPVKSSRRPIGATRSLDDVIGCEVKGNIDVGQTIPKTAVARPLLIRRREIVDVVAKTGGITIRRRARAMQNGAKGDLVMLQDLDKQNDHFTAYVVGQRLAQAFVSPTTVDNVTPETRR